MRANLSKNTPVDAQIWRLCPNLMIWLDRNLILVNGYTRYSVETICRPNLLYPVGGATINGYCSSPLNLRVVLPSFVNRALSSPKSFILLSWSVGPCSKPPLFTGNLPFVPENRPSPPPKGETASSSNIPFFRCYECWFPAGVVVIQVRQSYTMLAHHKHNKYNKPSEVNPQNIWMPNVILVWSSKPSFVDKLYKYLINVYIGIYIYIHLYTYILEILWSYQFPLTFVSMFPRQWHPWHPFQLWSELSTLERLLHLGVFRWAAANHLGMTRSLDVRFNGWFQWFISPICIYLYLYISLL